jgi:hypothetical protein
MGKPFCIKGGAAGSAGKRARRPLWFLGHACVENYRRVTRT